MALSERLLRAVLPATPARWPDVEAVLGGRGDPGWCWCQFFLTTGSSYQESAPANREALHRQVTTAEVPPGLLLYDSGEPVGWLQLGPRQQFPRVTGNAALARAVGPPDAPGEERVWRTTCFVVRVGHRRRGVARELLRSSVAWAREHGATQLEGHPVDLAARGGRAPGAVLYHGTLSMFLAEGFTEVGRTGAHRPVVRRRL